MMFYLKRLELLMLIVGLGLLIFATTLESSLYRNTFLPNTLINGINIESLTPNEAKALLKQKKVFPDSYTINMVVDDIYIASDSSQIPLNKNIDQLIEEAWLAEQSHHPIAKVATLVQRIWKPHYIELRPEFNSEKLAVGINVLKNIVDIEGENPSASLPVSNSPRSLIINPGTPGRSLDVDVTIALAQSLLNQVPTNNIWDENIVWNIEAIVASTSSPLSPEGVEMAKERAQIFIGKTISLEADGKPMSIQDTDLIPLLSFPSSLNPSAINDLIKEIASIINQPPTNALFSYNKTTLEVSEFVAHQNGLKLNEKNLREIVEEFMVDLEENKQYLADENQPVLTESNNQPHQLLIDVAAPDIALADINDLGINERIGFGESWYQGSIRSRTHNIAVASNIINLTIIKPGEEYSFNSNLGEVSAKTGFQQAYIIKGGATILGDGGGVCQVSSTLFRTLLDSGVDITRRLPHSYRVSYYEQRSDPGFDATVYSGNVDLRFINDTNNHLLLVVQANSTSQYMTAELYGTNDGRTTETSDYQKWDARPAPPTQYIPDPSLAPGETRRIENAIPGLKTKFTHRVYDKEGKLLRENTYYSNYIPWAAKYLVGEGVI